MIKKKIGHDPAKSGHDPMIKRIYDWAVKKGHQVETYYKHGKVVRFRYKDAFIKAFLPYPDTKLSYVVANQITTAWEEFHDFKSFKLLLEVIAKTE